MERKKTSKKKAVEKNLTGKCILITGASAGIGKQAAKELAARGAKILMACRSEEKAKTAADEIMMATGNADIVIYKLELSSLESVRECAAAIKLKEERLDVLINNGGTAGNGVKINTVDGFELVMATNYYGHFLLTNLLLDLLKKSAPSRIINVSSVAHSWVSLDKKGVNDLNFKEKSYSQNKAYSQSKLCNVLFSLELSHRLQGTGVTSNSLHPGFVNTEIFKKGKTFATSFVGSFAPLFGRTESKGAKTTIYLASSEKVEGVTGKYFVDCKVKSESSSAKDKDLASLLWNSSLKDVGLEETES